MSNPEDLEERMEKVNEALHVPLALQGLFSFQSDRLSRLINGLE